MRRRDAGRQLRRNGRVTDAPSGSGEDAPACSQLHREISRWQGREVQECGPDLTASIELTPLGGGRLLARHRFSSLDDRWQLEADGTVTARGHSFDHDAWASAGFTLLPPYGSADAQPRLLVYDPRSTAWTLAITLPDILREGQTGPWVERTGETPPWNEPRPWGRQLVGLGSDLALDRNLGDGSARFWRFVQQIDGIVTVDPLPDLVGGPRDAFRRGHRLVPLGPGRLLEWLPVPCDGDDSDATAQTCARFTVWSYQLDAADGRR